MGTLSNGTRRALIVPLAPRHSSAVSARQRKKMEALRGAQGFRCTAAAWGEGKERPTDPMSGSSCNSRWLCSLGGC
jgi:hypothetical protein